MPGVYRIELGKLKAQEKETKEKRPYILKHKGAEIKKQCEKAMELMENYSIPKDEGPYADKDGKLERLAILLRETAEDKETGTDSIIEQTIDMFGYGIGFPAVINERIYRKSDELTTAGLVLSEKERITLDDNDEGIIELQDFFEGVMLAVGALRQMGINAYPSFSYLEDQGYELRKMLISVIDLKSETPLITFDPADKIHPPMSAVDIISDETALGITYLLQARNTLAKLTFRMAEKMENDNEMISEGEVNSLLKEAAELINEATLRSDEILFFKKFLGELAVESTAEAIASIPEMHPEFISHVAASGEAIGAFSIVYEAYQQVKLIGIHNNTSPENVEKILNNDAVIIGHLQDGLKFALECRSKVYSIYTQLLKEYNDNLA